MRASPNQLAPSRSVESAGRAETGTGLTGALKGTFLSGLEGPRARAKSCGFTCNRFLEVLDIKLAVWTETRKLRLGPTPSI